MTRKAHVYRVFQTDDEGNVTDPDTWIDVMRIDRTTFSENRGVPGGGVSHQDRIYVVKWGDDTLNMGDGPDASQARVYEPLKVLQPDPGNPNQDPNDPDITSVTIPLILKTQFSFRGGLISAQTVQWVFKNLSPQNSAQAGGTTHRKETLLRITNNDLNDAIKMPEPTEGDPQPPSDKGSRIDWSDYAQAIQDGTIDDTQYVDVEITDRFLVRFPPSPHDKPAHQVPQVLFGQIITYALRQKQADDGPPRVEDLFDPPSDGGEGPESPNVYRTDPFQAIVNVSWGGLAVEFGDGAEDAPAKEGT